MVNRLALTLDQSEYAALLEMAFRELRSPADQLRHILREELGRRGLLPAEGGIQGPSRVSRPPDPPASGEER